MLVVVVVVYLPCGGEKPHTLAVTFWVGARVKGTQTLPGRGLLWENWARWFQGGYRLQFMVCCVGICATPGMIGSAERAIA